MEMGDCEPSTSRMPINEYHNSMPLFVMDVIRNFQDHPKYMGGIKETDIVELWNQSDYACGDSLSQVKNALQQLCSSGFVRFVGNGYRTSGPFVSLTSPRNPRRFNGPGPTM